MSFPRSIDEKAIQFDHRIGRTARWLAFGAWPGGISEDRLTGKDDASVSTVDLANLARTLRPGGFVLVGELPMEAIAHWRHAATASTIITSGARAHSLERHGEVPNLDRLVIETIREPDAVHRDKLDELTANLFRAIDEYHDIVVAVRLGDNSSRYNSVKSARRQRRARRRRDEHRGLELWRKRSAGGTVTPA